MSLAVVDTSAWVSFFRKDSLAISRIDPLLADARAVVTGPIVAEILSGASSRADFNRLKKLLGALDRLPDPPELWDRIAETRFTLARKGYQTSLVDLAIALACLDGGHTLVTRDRDFRAIGRVLPLELEVF